jgi:regulator of nucleoside diphosphate kinase
MPQHELLIADGDARQLKMLLEGADFVTERDRIQWQALEEEIERARIVPLEQMPSSVVRMRSRVRIVDMRTGEQLVYQIVYPHEANYAAQKISILAPIGMALLGYPVGTEIEWQVPSGSRRLWIAAVEQPAEPERARAAA